jgi:hypothetical protein
MERRKHDINEKVDKILSQIQSLIQLCKGMSIYEGQDASAASEPTREPPSEPHTPRATTSEA